MVHRLEIDLQGATTSRRILTAISKGLIVAALFVCALASTASAQDAREQASVYYDRGVEAFEAGHYADALVAFQRAYELAPAVPVLYNLARVHEALDHPVEATAAYEQFLSSSPRLNRSQRTDVQAALTRLAPRIAHLVLQCAQPELRAEVDGIPVANATQGTSIPANPGQHAVTVRSGDTTLFQDVVQVGPGENKTLQCNELAAATATTGNPTATEPHRTAPLEPPPTPTHNDELSPTFIALVSTGAAVFAFGATATVVNELNISGTNDDVRTANNKSSEAGCDTANPGGTCAAIERKLLSLRDQQDAQDTWRIISIAAAGAGLVVAASSFLFLGEQSEDTAQMTITPSGATVRFAF